MTGHGRPIAVVAAATIGAGVVVLVVPDHAALVGHVWLVVVLTVALGIALGQLGRRLPVRPSAFDAAFVRARPRRARPASLARVEREVTLATVTAFDVHFRLRPLVRPLAAGLLLRRGVDLEQRPDRARELLGAETWELVRPDRDAPDDRTAPGIPIETVERVVADLERLGWS